MTQIKKELGLEDLKDDTGNVIVLDTVLPKIDWVKANKIDICQKLLDACKLHPQGDTTPWNERKKLMKIMETIEVEKEITESLETAEILPKTDDIDPNPEQYEVQELLQAIYENSYPLLNVEDTEGDTNETRRGKVLMFLLTIRQLAKLNQGSS